MAYKNYWAGEGEHQETYSKLYNKLVPNSGCSETMEGEMIRGVSRLAHDYFNNGNCNTYQHNSTTCTECYGAGEVEGDYDHELEEVTYDTCNNCYGSGEEEENPTINEYYANMIEVIKTCKDKNVVNLVSKVENIILRGYVNDFKEENEQVYNELVEKVVLYVNNIKPEDYTKYNGE